MTIYKFIILCMVLVFTCFRSSAVIADGDLGDLCGGNYVQQPCKEGLFCESRYIPLDLKGVFYSSNGGRCAEVPRKCAAVIDRVCGANGEMYINDCARRKAKLSRKHPSYCARIQARRIKQRNAKATVERWTTQFLMKKKFSMENFSRARVQSLLAGIRYVQKHFALQILSGGLQQSCEDRNDVVSECGLRAKFEQRLAGVIGQE